MIPIFHGMLNDEHVHDVLERILPMLGQEWVFIIRSVDSLRSHEDLAYTLRAHDIPNTVLNSNVCVYIDAIRKALSQGFFAGFDEVWIIAGSPPTFDLASLPSATSDGADFSSDVPEGLSRAMEQANCVLILGDGCGLNYATTSAQLQEELIGAGP